MKEVIIDGVKYVREDSLVINRNHLIDFLEKCETWAYLDILGSTIDGHITKAGHPYVMVEDMIDGENSATKKLFMIHIALNDL